MLRPWSAFAILLGASLLAGCSPPPAIMSLEPATGQPHEVVLVKGEELESAEIVWDAGSSTEKIIPGGYQGAYMFSVPDDATTGPHDVVLQKGTNRSMPFTFTVPPPPGPDSEPRP